MWSVDRSPRELIDHARYPIDVPGERCDETIGHVRDELAGDGCAVLPGFLSEVGLARLLDEARERAPRAFYADRKAANVHLGDGDPSLGTYFKQNIIGGAGAFVISADNFDDYGRAIRRKLLREILRPVACDITRDRNSPGAPQQTRRNRAKSPS